MSRTRITLAAALLVTTAVGVPSALAGGHACSKPGAAVIHDVHETSEALPVAGRVASYAAHEVEETYCSL